MVFFGLHSPAGGLFVILLLDAAIVATIAAYFAVAKLKHRLGYDDALDVFGIHGVAGIVGALGTALVYQPALGGPGDGSTALVAQLGIQALAVAIAIGWAACGTALIAALLKAVMGLRVDPETEYEGLDLGEHGERAYN